MYGESKSSDTCHHWWSHKVEEGCDRYSAEFSGGPHHGEGEAGLLHHLITNQRTKQPLKKMNMILMIKKRRFGVNICDIFDCHLVSSTELSQKPLNEIEKLQKYINEYCEIYQWILWNLNNDCLKSEDKLSWARFRSHS